METFYWEISGDFCDLPTQPTLPTLLSFFFNEKGVVIRDTFLVEVASTSSPHTLLSRNCQHSPSQPHTASLRTPVTNLGSGLYTASPGGGVALVPQSITDQITDQYAPYCSELGYGVLCEYRVLDVIRLRVRASNPPSGHHKSHLSNCNYYIKIVWCLRNLTVGPLSGPLCYFVMRLGVFCN